jgi:nicotinamidase-related amidase
MSTALLVVDVQNEVIDELTPDRRATFVAVLAELIARARAYGAPVVYIRHNDEFLTVGSKGWEIAAEIAPRPGEPIVDKRYRDAFRETDLQDVLARLGVDQVVICGIQTEFCVDATLREAERRGYAVTLAADAHATYPVEGATEEQIRAQVHRVAADRIAKIVPTAQLFVRETVHHVA